MIVSRDTTAGYEARLTPPVADAVSKRLCERQTALRFAQQEQDAVRGRQATVEGRPRLSALHRWKISGKKSIVSHARLDALVAREETHLASKSRPHSNGLHHLRYPSIKPDWSNLVWPSQFDLPLLVTGASNSIRQPQRDSENWI